LEQGLVFGDDPVHVACRNVDPKFMKLFGNQGLGDLCMVILVQDEADQSKTKMAMDLLRYSAHHIFVLGCLPTLKTVKRIVGHDDDVLNHVVLIPLEPAPFRDRIGLDDSDFAAGLCLVE